MNAAGMSITRDTKRSLAAEVARLLDVTTAPSSPPPPPFAGERFYFFDNVTFLLSEGWSMVVYFDQTDWDYVDRFVAPDGTILECDDPDLENGDGFWDAIFHWRPRAEHRPAWGPINWQGVP